MGKHHLLFIGSKARQGKDETANIISKLKGNTYIFHFGDPLKIELTNTERKYPLVIKKDNTVQILDNFAMGRYRHFNLNEVPYLKKILSERQIDKYWGQDGKDREMLQFWGTDYRRRKLTDNYWVNIVDQWIDEIISKKSNKDTYICIPDTRFKNEARLALKYKKHPLFEDTQNTSRYINVQRFNEDGTRYVAEDGDPNHASEIDLDDYEADYTIISKSGIENLELEVVKFLTEMKY